MNKKIVAIAAGTFALFGFLLIAYQLTNAPTEKVNIEASSINSTDHLKWSPAKKNILIEYSDFQCAACQSFHQLMRSWEASSSPDFIITKKLSFVYRHFPLPQHPKAMPAAYAAEAAGKQGKFFEMSDLLFNKQDEWKDLANGKDFFIKLAQGLTLDIERFKKDMEADDVKQKVNVDLSSGNAAGVNATPTFFLNGKKLEFKSLAEFKKLLLSL
jgi:protein-disulfide isomerase